MRSANRLHGNAIHGTIQLIAVILQHAALVTRQLLL
jgi:hypothetical protein